MTKIRRSWILLAVSGAAGCAEYTCLDTATCQFPDVDAGRLDSGVETHDDSDASTVESSTDSSSEAVSSGPPPATSTAQENATSGQTSEPRADSSTTSAGRSSETSAVNTEPTAETSTGGSSAATTLGSEPDAESTSGGRETSGIETTDTHAEASSSTDSETTVLTSTTSEPASSSAHNDDTSGPSEASSEPPEPTGDPNPSGFPEPGAGGVAKPSGAAGGLTVVNWGGFAGALSYTFDDATGSQHGNKTAMLALDVPFTWYLTTGAGGDPMNAMYEEALALGHELGNHTEDHTSNAADAESMQTWLMYNYDVVAYTMAAPNGATASFTSITNDKFLLDRGVSGQAMGPDGPNDWTNLPSSIPAQGAGEAIFKGYADTAAGGKWQTVCIHGFTTGGTGGYQPVSFDGWKAGVEYAKTKNIWITSMVNVAAYIIGGKAVKNASVSAEGGGQKYTWTLKDTFPPGHYVRVTVTGGKLSQDGVTLPWNEHGFYEVSLDAGELTLRP